MVQGHSRVTEYLCVMTEYLCVILFILFCFFFQDDNDLFRILVLCKAIGIFLLNKNLNKHKWHFKKYGFQPLIVDHG